MFQVEVEREKTTTKDGRVFVNWVLVVDGVKVPVRPLFPNGIEVLLEKHYKTGERK